MALSKEEILNWAAISDVPSVRGFSPDDYESIKKGRIKQLGVMIVEATDKRIEDLQASIVDYTKMIKLLRRDITPPEDRSLFTDAPQLVSGSLFKQMLEATGSTRTQATRFANTLLGVKLGSRNKAEYFEENPGLILFNGNELPGRCDIDEVQIDLMTLTDKYTSPEPFIKRGGGYGAGIDEALGNVLNSWWKYSPHATLGE